MKQLTVFLILLSIFLLSCTKNQMHNEYINEVSTDDLKVNINTEELQLRVEYPNEIIEFNTNKNELNYTLVAKIEPSVMNGHTLSATSICNRGDHAYVSFHTKGKTLGGEVLTLDVSSPENVQILQSLSSNTFDFNDLCISRDESKLWLCGDESNETSVHAFAMELALSNNIPSEEETWKKTYDAYSGNSITATYGNYSDLVWVTSGSNGGLMAYDQSDTSEDIFSFDADNCKHFSADKSSGVVIIGNGNNLSIIRVFDLNTPFEYTDYEIPYDVSQLGKNGIYIDRNTAYLAMGDDGLIVFDLKNGEITDVFRSDKAGTANAVFVEKDKVYLAYGSAGLYIIDKRTMESQGNWDYEGSCNYVCVNHKNVFIANGSGDGFLMLINNN